MAAMLDWLSTSFFCCFWSIMYTLKETRHDVGEKPLLHLCLSFLKAVLLPCTFVWKCSENSVADLCKLIFKKRFLVNFIGVTIYRAFPLVKSTWHEKHAILLHLDWTQPQMQMRGQNHKIFFVFDYDFISIYVLLICMHASYLPVDHVFCFSKCTVYYYCTSFHLVCRK